MQGGNIYFRPAGRPRCMFGRPEVLGVMLGVMLMLMMQALLGGRCLFVSVCLCE